MLKNITIGNYLHRDSLVHQLDPRAKLIFAFAFIISIFYATTYILVFWVSVFYLLLLCLAKVPLLYLLRGMKPILWLIGFMALIHLFITPGTVQFVIGPLSATEEGIHRAVVMAHRLFMLLSVSILLTASTPPLRITDGLQSLLAPLKRVRIPTDELALMLSIALRFIPTFMKEIERIMKAQMARGVDFSSGNVKERIENLLSILIPLFINSFRRAEDLALAMEARCYRGNENRTRLYPLRFKKKDYYAFMALFLYIGCSILLKQYG